MTKARDTLLEQMAVTPRYRANGLAGDERDLIVFAHEEKVREALRAIRGQCPHARIVGVCAHKGTEPYYDLEEGGVTVRYPALPPESVDEIPECTGVVYWSGAIVPDTLFHLHSDAARSRNMAIFPRIPYGTGRRHDPDLYRRHGKKLEEIYASLADEESKKSFASVVKGLVRGEIEWLRPATCLEYQYPRAQAEPGDIILDAGLFDSAVLRTFALQTGPTGHVYGFEPEPANFLHVLETLSTFGDPGNITLVKKGIYSDKRQMYISSAGSSGALTEDKDASPCDTIDIDSFVEENGIKNVHLIKMDIEGSEMEALKGAAKTISHMNPKLHICAYHKIDDIVNIYNFISAITPGYKFYFSAHAPYLNEFIYYAVPKK